MYHLDNTSGVPEMPEPKEQQSISPRWFGESVEQGGISWPGADWFNTVQAELLNLLKEANISPDKKAYNQLSQAIPVLGDAKIRSDLTSNDGFKLVGQFPDIVALMGSSGSDGDRVKVQSYIAGTGFGGGEFIYDASKSTINNGVTVFFGWVRQSLNNTLSTWDAGLIPGDGTDARERIQSLFDSAADGQNIVIHGHHDISGVITVKNKSGLTVSAVNGVISGKAFSINWEFGYDPDFEYGSGNLGLLSFFNCPGTTIDGVTFIGAHRQRPDSKEWGDCAVRYEHSPHFTIRNCTGTGFGGWGIFGMYSDYSTAYQNVIGNVSRQSGINIFACSSYCSVHHNTIYDVGLYGIEVETFPSKPDSETFGNSVYNNDIRNAKFGICIVGNHNDVSVKTNLCYGCKTGIFSIKSYGNNIEIGQNIMPNCLRGVQVNASKNVLISYNNYQVTEVPDYVLNDQYNAVIDIVSGNRAQFYSINGLRAGYVIQIRGFQYSVVSSVQDPSRTDYQAQAGGLYLNTLSTALDGAIEHCDNVYVAVNSLALTPYGFAANAEASAATLIDSTENIRFVKNTASGKIAAALFSGSLYSDFSTIKEWWQANVIQPDVNNPYICRWFRFQQGCHSGLALADNTYDKLASVFSSATGGPSDHVQPKVTRRFEYEGAVTPGNPFTPHYIVSDGAFAIVGVRVALYNFSGSEDVYLQVNGSENTIKVAQANPVQKAVTSFNVRELFFTLTGTGVIYFRLATSGNTASLAGYSIELDIV